MSIRIDRLREKIKAKDIKINALLDLTMAINENAPTSELLRLFENNMRHSLGVECLVLYAREDDVWTAIESYGVEGTIPLMDDIRFEELQSDIQLPEAYRKWTQNKFDYVIPVFHDGHPLACLMVGDITEEENKVSPVVKHMRYIQTITNVLVVAIRNKKLVTQNLERKMLQRELELAAEMQSMLVPQRLPSNTYVSVDAYYRPHSSIGGDYYDFIEIEEGVFVTCMADVSGKGAGAALLMANFQANLRAIFSYCSFSLEETIAELNRGVMRSAKGEKFITFFVAKYDANTGTLEYVNCGHNPPILIDARGEVELLSLGSFGLGMFDDMPKVNKGLLEVEEGSTLFCYTDGLVETENDHGEEWGMEALVSFLKTNKGVHPQKLIAEVIATLDAHSGRDGFIDDTAVLACRIGGVE